MAVTNPKPVGDAMVAKSFFYIQSIITVWGKGWVCVKILSTLAWASVRAELGVKALLPAASNTDTKLHCEIPVALTKTNTKKAVLETRTQCVFL